MDKDQNETSNILQFPGNRKVSEVSSVQPQIRSSQAPSAKALGGLIVAIMVATVAVNGYVFKSANSTLDLTSVSANGRTIASVGRSGFERDARWEKDLAERLASAKMRTIASVNLGRPATVEEKLRWGVLEEKYTITYGAESENIRTVLFQGDKASEPSYVLDRSQFLSDFGPLFAANFDSAKLKSVERGEQSTVEFFTVFDKNNQPKGEVRFELDRHQRLISIKVEPLQI